MYRTPEECKGRACEAHANVYDAYARSRNAIGSDSHQKAYQRLDAMRSSGNLSPEASPARLALSRDAAPPTDFEGGELPYRRRRSSVEELHPLSEFFDEYRL